MNESYQPPAPPAHVAIIMDGNGRWAQARGLPRVMGHRRGVEAVRTCVRTSARLGIRYLTLYAFSSENWRRPETEVTDLMGLLRIFLRSEIAELHREGVRVRIIGQRERLAKDIRALIDNAEALTAENTRLNLVVALSYGGRDEILQAARRLARSAQAGEVDLDRVEEEDFGRLLFTHDIPDPDVLVRTSGEQRISNFLLWQCAYSEMVFVERHWPDFGEADLEHVIREYHGRDRRFGASAGSSR